MPDIEKASQLSFPSISGQVTMSLAEIDKLRSEAVAAVRLAQKLEERQKQVKIEITQQIARSQPNQVIDSKGRLISNSWSTYTDREVVKVDYVNLDDAQKILRDEERLKVDEEMTRINNSNVSLAKSVEEKTTIISKLLTELADVKKELASIKRQDKELTDANASIQNMRSRIDELMTTRDEVFREKQRLQDELILWKEKKSLWYWIWGAKHQ